MRTKNIFLTIGLLSSLLISSCEKEKETVNQPNSLLMKSWTHSYEENTEQDIEIYRPSDYLEFPMSWYRQIYIFGENNFCQYRVLAPNDAHYMKNGSWEYLENKQIIDIFNEDHEIIFELEVVELSEDILKLKK